MQNNGKLDLAETLIQRAELEQTGWIDAVCWLSDDLLLMTGWFHLPGEQSVEACFVGEDSVAPLEVRCLSYPLPPIPGDTSSDQNIGKVLTARFLQPPEDQNADLGRLVITSGGSTFSPRPLSISATTDLFTVLQTRLKLVDWQQPERMLDFLTDTLRAHTGTTNIARLSRSVAVIRETLRKPLASFLIVPEQPRCIYADIPLAIDETSFFIQGWISDPDEKIDQLTIISPEGCTTDITKLASYFPRPDVADFFKMPAEPQGIGVLGFAGFFTTDFPSFALDGWFAQFRNTSGDLIEARMKPATRDYTAIKDAILEVLAIRDHDEKFIADHAIPALTRLQHLRQQQIRVESIEQYGEPPATPEVSIVIPLYKRMDFLEQQLAQFVLDPEIQKSDLIYVLDSPEDADNLVQLAGHLFDLYRIPFRLVILSENFGYSAANNIGAALARGPLLLLLNSDILPKDRGWVGRLTSFYDAMPGIGALGPKLLFEDDSLQHAGLYFEWFPDRSLWMNQHYYKGYHRQLPAANKPRAVPAITGACMMVATNLYKQLGGLRGTYIQGDFEDSDFCLRLIETGLKNWYLPDVELYHLEGQSYPSAARQLTHRYNAALQTELWGDLIPEVMSRFSGRDSTPPKSQSWRFPARRPLKNKGESDPDSKRQPKSKVIRTTRSDLVNLYLQTCSVSWDRKPADSSVWIMSEAGGIIDFLPSKGSPMSYVDGDSKSSELVDGTLASEVIF